MLGFKRLCAFFFLWICLRSLNLTVCQRFAMVGISGNGPGPGPKFCSSSSGILHMHRHVLQSFPDTFWKYHFEINSLHTFDVALCGIEITFWIRNQFCVLNTDLNIFNEAAYCLKIKLFKLILKFSLLRVTLVENSWIFTTFLYVVKYFTVRFYRVIYAFWSDSSFCSCLNLENSLLKTDILSEY